MGSKVITLQVYHITLACSHLSKLNNELFTKTKFIINELNDRAIAPLI